REARSRFFSNSDLRVLGLGLPLKYRDSFLAAAAPPPSRPGSSPEGRSGCLRVLDSGGALPGTGVALGFELLNVDSGPIDHSWLCNGLERYFADNLRVSPAPNGFLPDLGDAVRCCEAIERGDVGAEPGPWFPWLIVDYPSVG